MAKASAENVLRCAASDCSGGQAHRQRDFPHSQAQADKFPADLKERIAAHPGILMRCTYCGCVYVRSNGEKTILGFWDDPMRGDGWFPQQGA